MSAFKGTPGPWVRTIKFASKEVTIGRKTPRDFEVVVTVRPGLLRPEEDYANAALIAQAPAMLEVLLQLHSNDLTGSERIEPILAALREGGAI